MTRLFRLAAAATAVALPVLAGAQTVTSSPGTTYSTSGPITDNVRVDQMGGLSLTAYWGNTSRSYSLSNLGGGLWGWSDSFLRLRAAGGGDTFFNFWSFDNLHNQSLTRLVFDGGPTQVLFDRGTGNEGTPGSNLGADLMSCGLGITIIVPLCLQGDQWNTTAHYTNAVALSPNAPVGDLYRTLDVNFRNGGIASGVGTDAFLRFDTDRSSAAVVTPEPSTYALFGVGLAIVGIAARRKRSVAQRVMQRTAVVLRST